ncbi:MAG: TRAP transporter small permease subunit [Deltaproteobacteria bacterium]|nr:TRAP transporter small permease subunit [Deltaproteobacteria bacterium]
MLFLGMIGMAITQIILRTFFGFGIVWGDSLVRLLVLWTGLLGAMVATRQDRHIRIDLISRYLSKKIGLITGVMIRLFSAGVCIATAYYGGKLVSMEYQFTTLAFARVPAWACELIIPFGFAVMALRFLVSSINLFKGISAQS